MTDIKCRYNVHYCDNPDCDEISVDWNEDFFCDDYCYGYKRPSDAPINLVNPICKFSRTVKKEFEKSVKAYEYDDDDGLTIGRKKYRSISYLEIDGRVLVNEEENT